MTNINSRALNIINILLNSDQPVSSITLSQEIGCSTKTIQSEIKLLNKELKNAQILSIRGVGYKLEGSVEDININSDTYNDIDRVHYIIKTLLILSSKESNAIRIEDLADLMYVSTSTIKNDLKEVKKILAKYNIEILTKHKQGIYIDKIEENIIKCIIDLCINLDNELNLNEFLSDVVKNNIFIIKKIVLNSLNNEKLILLDTEFKNIINHVLLYLSRGNYNNEEFIKNYINDYKNKRNIVINDCKNKDRIKSAINEFCENLKLATSINIKDDEIFKDCLYNHINSLYKKIKLGIESYDIKPLNIKIKYPFAFELAKIAKKTIEKDLDIEINENEIANIAIHVGGALERASYNNEKKTFKTIIVCTSGIGTSMLIKSKLENIFKEKIEILKIMPAYLVDYINAMEVDFIISTVSINIESIPVINISPILRDKEIKIIEKYIETENVYVDINIKNIFDKELFFINLDFKNKEDVIDFMSNKLIELGYIDSDMKNSFFEREKIATTEIGNMVAIPHGANGIIYNNKIAIGILKNPINWELSKVRLVIMLAVNPETVLDYEELFSTIYKRVDSIAKVVSICENGSFEKFVNMFK